MLDVASFLDVVSLVIAVELDFKSEASSFIIDAEIYIAELFTPTDIIEDNSRNPPF